MKKLVFKFMSWLLAANVKIKLLSSNAKIPTRATDGSAAYDAYTPYDFVVRPGRNILPLDIAVAMPKWIKMNVRSRSGFSAKGIEGRFLSTELERFNADVTLGLVDSDYRNSIGAIIYSREKVPFTIVGGTRICQLEFGFVPVINFEQVDELNETERKGGFGHSGTK